MKGPSGRPKGILSPEVAQIARTRAELFFSLVLDTLYLCLTAGALYGLQWIEQRAHFEGFAYLYYRAMEYTLGGTAVATVMLFCFRDLREVWQRSTRSQGESRNER